MRGKDQRAESGGVSTGAYTRSAWPDLVVGIGIGALNADAAREVWKAAREEHAAAKPEPVGEP